MTSTSFPGLERILGTRFIRRTVVRAFKGNVNWFDKSGSARNLGKKCSGSGKEKTFGLRDIGSIEKSRPYGLKNWESTEAGSAPVTKSIE